MDSQMRTPLIGWMLCLVCLLAAGACRMPAQMGEADPVRQSLVPRTAWTTDDSATTTTFNQWLRALNQHRRWTAEPSRENQVDIAPNSRFLIYVSDQPGSRDIFRLELPPARPRPPQAMITTQAEDYAPRISPDGKRIVYVSTIDDALGDIWMARVDGGNPVRLTDRTTRDMDPTWLPDGESILFVSQVDNGAHRMERLDLATQKREVLEGTEGRMPCVSSDGRWLAFVDAQSRRLVLHELQSGERNFITDANRPVANPRFSEDGALIFSMAADDTNTDGRYGEGDRWTIWRAEWSGPISPKMKPTIFPLTTTDWHSASPAPFAQGFFFAARTDRGSMDIFSSSQSGAYPLPRGLAQGSDELAGLVRRIETERPNRPELAIGAWRQIESGRFFQALASSDSGSQKLKDVRNEACLEEVRLLQAEGRLDQALDKAQNLKQGLDADDPFFALATLEIARTKTALVERSTNNPKALLDAREKALQTILGLSREYGDPRVDSEATLEAAQLFGRLGKLQEAIRETDRLLQKYVDRPDVMAQSLLLRGSLQEQIEFSTGIPAAYGRILRDYSGQRRETIQAASRIVNLRIAPIDAPEAKRRALYELISDPETLALLAAIAQNRVGDLWAEEERLADALDAYQRTIEEYSDQTEAVAAARFAQSRLYFEQGRYGESVEAYESIERRLRPRDDVWYDRARRGFIRQTLLKAEAEYRDNDPALARATFASLLDYDPGIYEAWRGILRSDNALGRIPESIYEINRRLEDRPDFATLRYARGLALSYVDGQRDASVRELESAMLLDPASPYPHQTLGYLFEQEMIRTEDSEAGARALYEYQLALALLDRELVPYNYAALLSNTGNASRLLRLWGLAQRYYTERARLAEDAEAGQAFEDPRTAYLFWRHAGEAAFKAGDTRSAENFYAQALKVLPEAKEKDTTQDWDAQQTELLDRRALALQELGRYEEAANLFARVAESSGDPRAEALATRNQAVNLYLLAEEQSGETRTDLLRESWEAFRQAENVVRREGVIDPKDRQDRKKRGWFGLAMVVGLAGGEGTAAGQGFDKRGELRLIQGFMGWISESAGKLEDARKSLKMQIDQLPKITDSNRAYVLTERAILLSRLAQLHEALGDYAAAGQATLDSLEACRWMTGDAPSTNTRGAAMAAMNLARLWASHPEALPRETQDCWLTRFPSDESDKSDRSDRSDSGSALIKILQNARRLMDASPTPPAAVLLPDLIYHQALVEWRIANDARYALSDSDDPVAMLHQSAAFIRHALHAQRLLGRDFRNVLDASDPKAIPLDDMAGAQDRERWRRLDVAARLQEARILGELGRIEDADRLSSQAVSLATSWRYDDLLFAHFFESGLNSESRLELWRQAAEVANRSLPGQRSDDRIIRAMRATIGSALARDAAESGDAESAWTWSEWALMQDQAAAMEGLSPEFPDAESREIFDMYRELRNETRRTLARWRRSMRKTNPALPEMIAELEALQERRDAWQEDASALKPELALLFSGRAFALGNVIDFVDPEGALIRTAMLDGRPWMAVLTLDGIESFWLDIAPDAPAEELARAALLPIRDKLPDLKTMEWMPDVAFMDVPIEAALPREADGAPLAHRLSFCLSTAQRYLAQMQLAPWRDRLVTAAIDNDGMTTNPYSWTQRLGASASSDKVVRSLRLADVARVGWPLSLNPRDPAESEFLPSYEATTAEGLRPPGGSIEVSGLFSAGWSLSCVGIEKAGFSRAAHSADRGAALHFFLNAMAWGGAPSVFAGPFDADQNDAMSDEIARAIAARFWLMAADHAPAEALRQAINETARSRIAPARLAGFRVWGHPGLTAEAAEIFAVDEFESRLGKAVNAHKSGDWSEAARYFRQSLILIQMIEPEDSRIPQIAKLAASDADKAELYALGVQASDALLSFYRRTAASELDQAAAHRLRGILLSKEQRFDEATAALGQAVRLFRKNEDYAALLDATTQLGVVLENAGRYEQALEQYRRAQTLCNELGAPEEEASQWQRIAKIQMLRLGRYDKAATAAEKALEIYTALEAPAGRAESLLDLGTIRERQARFDEALDLYERAGKIAEDLGDTPLLARTALNQANTYWLTGNYLNCLKRQNHAMDLVEKALDQNELSRSQRESLLGIRLAAFNTAGLLYWALNDYDRAMVEFDEALRLSRQLENPAEEASTLNNMGLVWRSREKYDRAIETFRSALRIDLERRDRWGQGYDHRNIGMTQLRAGQPDRARESLLAASAISEKLGDWTNYSKAVLSLGDTELELEDIEAARSHHTEALRISRERSLPEVEWRALRGLSRDNLAQGDRGMAIEEMDKAVEVVESMRASIRVEQLQDGFLADKQELYEEMVIMLLDEGRSEDAFNYSERARGRNFIDLLGNQQLELQNRADQELLDRNRELHERLQALQRELADVESDDQRTSITRAIEATQREMNDLLVRIQAENPALSSFVRVEPLTLEELQKLLDGDSCLVEYFLTEKETIIWVLGNDRIDVVRQPENRDDLQEKVMEYRRKIQSIEPVRDLSLELHRRLVDPIESLIADRDQLGIVPHRFLHYLSFASLSSDYGQLIDRHALFYLPSASVFRYTHSRRRDTDGPASPSDMRVLAIGNPDLQNPLLELPFAEKEAERLVWQFPRVDILTGDRATEASVRESIAQYDVIHIASHGEFDSANPLFSSILLASGDEADGALTVREVFALSINADLVTLSACQTGLAKVNNGDDLVGLNRAFVYAGTHALLSTLWRVDDVATAILVKHFYRNYGRAEKAEALRRAQVQVRSERPHPAYWAGMVLTGDWR
ncbi:MAG: CHAT domain-containing protein [Candidatus Sumerlaeia bacterium]